MSEELEVVEATIEPEPDVKASDYVVNLDDLVPLRYVMDPDEVDLIAGSLLKNGQEVLIEGAHMRGDPAAFKSQKDISEYEYLRILETSRWCKVTELKSRDSIQRFVGVYSDGTKFSRVYNHDYYWFVKKSSLVDQDEV